jgi:RNA polymerase sigma-70 factor, ECF subfamily
MEQRTFDELEPRIVQIARQGDAKAFAQLVQHYQSVVYNLAYRLLGEAAEAEDAAQETFLRAYLQLKSYNTERRFAPWLLSIATHYCIDRLRRGKYAGPSLDEDNMQDALASDRAEPEEIAIAHERSADAQYLLGKLPPAYRAVVALKYWNDMSVEEIAKATDDSISGVKVKLFRARRAMARELSIVHAMTPHRNRPAAEAAGAPTHAH